MKRLVHKMDRVLGFALIVTTLAMVLIVLLQIIARFALPWPFHWTEELARLFFIYMASLGAGLALKDQAYVNVATVLQKLPVKAKTYLESVILLSIIVLMLCMFLSCFPLFEIVKLQTSAALNINMVYMYASMMFMSFFIMLYAFIQLIEKLRQI